MKRSALTMIRCAFASLSFAASAHAAVPSDPPATYERDDENVGGGSIELEQIGSEWRVTVVVGGIPSGSATAADCGFIVQGDFSGHDFRGRVVTVGSLPDVDKGTPSEAGLDFAFSLKGEVITVKYAASELCHDGGLGGYIINGDYVRTFHR